MAKPKKRVHIPPLPPEEAYALMKKLDEVVREFDGQFDELENALGMMLLGRLVGWKLLALIHNKRSIRKYEEILGIKIREAFPEEGPLTHKSAAYELIKKLGNYWKAVSGETKVEDRRTLQPG
jgi:hypothetical protein